ncbi:adenylosuccinate lyase [Primorskyibacter sedentarius]|uniref:Chitin binding peritrophin-A-like protein n=1 Tax=Primorskyibacter sedentarius TaxID=745311 RepID=A0A4R3JF56_9RHOB|nr:adenylosuccinate lyase [Primorskyibacter sedentarius]TCS63776.1 hypothetical protein EDD52_10643 [Primorskyibacter sedentarius]
MKLKTILAAAALTVVPALGAWAACSGHSEAMSCAQGTVYDSATGTCVKQVTG